MTIPAYAEIVELIAAADPKRIIAFQPSQATIQRIQELLLKKSDDTLSAEESSELNYYVWLENLIGLAKARANQILQAA